MQQGVIKGANSWIEGCWNLQRRASEKLPGLVLGTGFGTYAFMPGTVLADDLWRRLAN